MRALHAHDPATVGGVHGRRHSEGVRECRPMSRAVHLLGATNSGVDSAAAVVAAGAQLWRRPLW